MDNSLEEIILDHISETEFNTEKIVDNRFVRKLEDEGFFRSLYAKK